MTEETISLDVLLDKNLSDDQVGQQVANYCRIDLANLDTALARHPALYAYTVAAYELSKVQEARKKWEVEEAKAFTYQALQAVDQKTSVSSADKKIPNSANVKAAMESLFSIQGVVARLKALSAGLEHRRDMLVQISAKQRQEMQT